MTAINSWDADMPNLIDGSYMFRASSLKKFEGDLSSLVNGDNMFYFNYALTEFIGDLSSLKSGYRMFSTGDTYGGHAPLSIDSIEHIANTINDISMLNKYNDNDWVVTFPNNIKESYTMDSYLRGALYLGYDGPFDMGNGIYYDRIASAMSLLMDKGWNVTLNGIVIGSWITSSIPDSDKDLTV